MDVDVVILGCTHYPILKNTIRKVVGDSVTIVDSAGTRPNATIVVADNRILAIHEARFGEFSGRVAVDNLSLFLDYR